MNTVLRFLVFVSVFSFWSVSYAGGQTGYYPSSIVTLEKGSAVCLSAEKAVSLLDAINIAEDTRTKAQYPPECDLTRFEIKITVTFVKSYEDKYVRADILRYLVFKEVGPGLFAHVDTRYGFYVTKMKPQALYVVQNT